MLCLFIWKKWETEFYEESKNTSVPPYLLGYRIVHCRQKACPPGPHARVKEGRSWGAVVLWPSSISCTMDAEVLVIFFPLISAKGVVELSVCFLNINPTMPLTPSGSTCLPSNSQSCHLMHCFLPCARQIWLQDPWPKLKFQTQLGTNTVVSSSFPEVNKREEKKIKPNRKGGRRKKKRQKVWAARKDKNSLRSLVIYCYIK